MRSSRVSSTLMFLVIVVGLVPLLADSPGPGDDDSAPSDDTAVVVEILAPTEESAVGSEFTLQGALYIGESSESAGPRHYVDFDPEVVLDFEVAVTARVRVSPSSSFRTVATIEVDPTITGTEIDSDGVRYGLWEVDLNGEDLRVSGILPGEPFRLTFDFSGDYDGRPFFYQPPTPLVLYRVLPPDP